MNIFELKAEKYGLENPKIVLRDSLGVLAVHILEKRFDISDMPTAEILDKLLGIIEELHCAYAENEQKFD